MPDPELYTNLILYTVYAVLALTVAATLWSAARTLRQHRFLRRDRIAFGVLGLLVAVLAATWLLGSTQPLMVGGKPYDDAFWLRAADMFIFSTLILIVLCFAAIITAKFRR